MRGESLLDQEVVGVAGRWSEHDNDRDNPVLEQTGSRGLERFVASPES